MARAQGMNGSLKVRDNRLPRFPQPSTDFCLFSSGFPPFPRQASVVSLRMVAAVDNMTRLNPMPKHRRYPGQILMFPSLPAEAGTAGDRILGNIGPSSGATALDIQKSESAGELERCDVVLSGSYRKDFDALKATYEELLDLGCKVLSPSNVSAVSETDGFVYMKGEESQTPGMIEGRHLDAIQRANFVWLHAPQGYVGPTSSLEVGFARALGVPVFAKEPVTDPAIHSFVRVTSSPAEAIRTMRSGDSPVPQPALNAFQHYYRRVAIQRGYSSEGPKECLLLMVEEVGELAREIRRRERLVRHGAASSSDEGKELADIFLYVVHMANVLEVDLSKLVQEKELINLQRFLTR
jgi:NTP pyrophosphatase (non-canonical NTP hydrolase)